MTNTQEKVKLAYQWILGTAGSGGSILLSFEQRIELWLRVITLIAGLVVSALTALSIVRGMIAKGRMGKLREAEAESNLCHACRHGSPPPQCPIEPKLRPRTCPRAARRHRRP